MYAASGFSDEAVADVSVAETTAETTAEVPTLPRSRGMLVVIEGGDAAGKTTLARRLVSERGYVYVKSPDRTTPTGQVLDSFIKGLVEFSPVAYYNERAAQMLFASAALQGRSRILELLESGQNVVMDRGVASGVVYHSVAQDENASSFILMLHQGMPRPDLGFVLDVDPTVAASRRADFGSERNDTHEIQSKVRAGFDSFFGSDRTYRFINAARAPDQVFEVVTRWIDHFVSCNFFDAKSAVALY